jgi:hypothetical protein
MIFNKKSNTRIGDFQIDFLFRVSKVKKGFAIGTYSICDDGKHVIYLDYDNFRFEWLLDELRMLRDKYKLSTFYVFRSSKDDVGKYKHHVVCFDKINARLYNEIVLSSNADVLFKNNGFFDLENSRVLRFSKKQSSDIGKPYFLCTVSSGYNKYNKSQSHINFYQKMFDINEKFVNRLKQDDSKQVRIIRYLTKNI